MFMLAEPKALRSFLDRHGLSAKKSLGQHFLASPSVVRAIADAVRNCQGVFEIGPGPGILTSAFCEAGLKVCALELDERMIPLLSESAECARVMKGDALKEDYVAILNSLPEARAVVSNLPYYITGPLLTRIAAAKAHFDCAVLMMQKEVGLKVMAPIANSERGSLSVFLQMQFDVRKVCDAPAGAFLPPPSVDSLVLKLSKKQLGYEPAMETFLFAVIRGAFRQPRKTLVNNLLTSKMADREWLEAFLAERGLDAKFRPQFVPDEIWIELATSLPTSPICEEVIEEA